MSCKNVYVMGPSGSGKSTLIERIYEHCISQRGGYDGPEVFLANELASRDKDFMDSKKFLGQKMASFLQGRSLVEQVQLAWFDYFLQRNVVINEFLKNSESDMIMLWDRDLIEMDMYNIAYCSCGMTRTKFSDGLLDAIVSHAQDDTFDNLKSYKRIVILPDCYDVLSRLKSRGRAWDKWVVNSFGMEFIAPLYDEYGDLVISMEDTLKNSCFMIIDGEYDVDDIVRWINE